jgi:hypothetical protein
VLDETDEGHTTDKTYNFATDQTDIIRVLTSSIMLSFKKTQARVSTFHFSRSWGCFLGRRLGGGEGEIPEKYYIWGGRIFQEEITQIE